jgi:hypothetical protein
MPRKKPALPDELQAATDFANDPRMLAAFAGATRDDKVWNRATQDPRALLREQGVTLPPGLEVYFLDPTSPGKPAPDWEWFFTVELTQCRKYWIKKQSGQGWELVEFCRGFVVVPRPIPGGPIA